MATGAARMMLHCVFEGSLSMSEMDKERRPYHKNCSCVLHKPKDETPRACIHHGRISYSKKLSWKNYEFWEADAHKSALLIRHLVNELILVAYTVHRYAYNSLYGGLVSTPSNEDACWTILEASSSLTLPTGAYVVINDP
ncbi:hypothetical protein L6452_02964 [Arctium lappa]|uniref:Uncharacterized protein n=1 Tax=Arctium lappa TaxID=4217 RepID=A0ACB9FLT7_ARCLA|nr:hypothetical protein L6452_02964 [Arctium lappa]